MKAFMGLLLILTLFPLILNSASYKRIGSLDTTEFSFSGDIASLATGGVDTDKIADDAVTAAKIDDDAVITVGIIDDAVTLAKMKALARGSVIVGGAADAPTALSGKTTGQVLVGDGTDLGSVAISGDGGLTSAGVFTSKQAEDTFWVGDASGDAQEYLLDSSISQLESILELAEALRATMNAHAADATEHGTAADATNFPLTSATATTKASLITLVSEMITDYTAHNADAILAVGWAFHGAQGTDRALASIDVPTTVAECVTRINDIKAKYNLHQADAVSHAAGDVYPEDVADSAIKLSASKYLLWKGRFLIQTGKNDTTGSYNIGPVLPDNSIIVNAFVDVLTTFAGDGDDSTTIALTSGEGANDIVNAVAIKTGTPWDGGLQAAIPVNTVATMIKLTAAHQPQIVIAIAVTDTLLSAGELILYIEYIVSE